MDEPFALSAHALCPNLTPLAVQVDAAARLTRHGRLIATLPTGSGKTHLAALPFAAGLLVPRQMVFMTPLRTLTDAQARALTDPRTGINPERASAYLGIPWSVRQQTGTAPEDPEFTAPAVICTFDQALSSALAIAYSTSRRRREINAGAVLGAYLVCDELHLFPRDEALTTLLWLLKHRPELPFTLMTATLSQPIAEALAHLLDAELITRLPPEDVAQLGIQQRTRVVRWQEQPLDAARIVRALDTSPDGRAIVVANTVRRAQELGRELTAALGEEGVLVLHARFYPDDRARIEGQLQQWMGKHAAPADGPRVLVATQVVEAGLDISAGLLFSEWAPANALAQRWGRCARWGGDGLVTIAPPDLRGGDLPQPYAREKDGREVLERTRAWLRQHAGGGIAMDAHVERQFLDYAHADTDRRWVDGLRERLHQQAGRIGQAIESGLYSHAGSLVRHVDNRTLLVHGAPEELDAPLRSTGFGLARGTLYGVLKGGSVSDVQPDEEGDLISFDLPDAAWVLKRPVWGEESERRAGRPARWEVATAQHLSTDALFAINPALVGYDPRFGLSFHGDQPAGREWWAAPVARDPRPPFGRYQRETYDEHVAGVLAVFEERACLWPTLEKVAGPIEALCGWPSGMLRTVIRAAIVLHDAGKLTARWQGIAREYQRSDAVPWLVHTDQRPDDRLPTVPHAPSGAAHTLGVGEALDAEVIAWRTAAGSARRRRDVLPSRVLFTAVMRHHSADTRTEQLREDEILPAEAVAHVREVLHAHALADRIIAPRPGIQLLPHYVVSSSIQHRGQDAEYLAYAVVARALRLADGWSQERGSASNWTRRDAARA